MRCFRHYGFTIVEISIVIAVIGVLTSIALVSFNQVQKQSRDNKRKADIAVMQSELEQYYEKNGEYPTGCSKYTIAQASFCNVSNNYPTSASSFNADTTLTSLRSTLPGIGSSFGDPLDNAGYPFGLSNYGFSQHYFYIGQMDSNTAAKSSSGLFGGASGEEITCSAGTYTWYGTPAGALPKATTYLLAYYGEATGKWYIYQGKYGYRLTTDIAGTTPAQATTRGNCVFMPVS